MIREHVLIQRYFSWKEIEKAIDIEIGGDELGPTWLLQWHHAQDDYVDTGLIGKKHNIVKQLADLEKSYAKQVKSGEYQNVPFDSDFNFDHLTIAQMDDRANLILLRAFVKILGDAYAKGFHILYDWED